MPDKSADDKARPDKSDLVNEAMSRLKLPSHEAWALTVDELKQKLEPRRG